MFVSGLLGRYELHLTTDSPATTGVEVTVTASLVASDNGSLVLPTSFHFYRFHWIHTPLLLTGKTEEAFSSTIRAVGNTPGDFPVSVWVTAANCWICQPVARSLLVLSITEFLMGNLVVTQNTSLPWPNYLAKTALKISFLLHDPSNFFKTASFLYSWDFGDGTQMITEDSVVYYNYSITGTVTVKLRVVAEWERATPDAGKGVAQRTGDFSTSLKLQETLRGIQVSGPTQLQNFQKMTVTLNFLGSPPLTLCWRLKPECLPLEEGECHPVSVAGTAYNLTYVFREPGDYCFSIRAENVISKTHQYHRIQVWPSSKCHYPFCRATGAAKASPPCRHRHCAATTNSAEAVTSHPSNISLIGIPTGPDRHHHRLTTHSLLPPDSAGATDKQP
ncbi:Transmembrane protein 130 [Pteropus alecto]|uniref:Transmembrane protein 130 n=1 Tax=Pteropus alecto TaxID=9402 RepID=L5L312_PTEAL|nr:Transmembrane protein 130 [Pteropus alecto]